MAETPDSLRLDKFLWFARIAKTRAQAQALAERGHLRLNGRAISQAHVAVHVGDTLTFATYRGEVRILRIEALPIRRGSPPEARALYCELTSEGGGA